MDLDTELYDGREGLEMSALYLVGILIYANGFKPLVNEGYHSLFINKCTQNVRLQSNLFEFKDCYCVIIKKIFFCNSQNRHGLLKNAISF